MTEPHDPEHIEAKKAEIRSALDAEGIDLEDLEEMDLDDAIDAIGRALLEHGEELPSND